MHFCEARALHPLPIKVISCQQKGDLVIPPNCDKDKTLHVYGDGRKDCWDLYWRTCLENSSFVSI